MVCNGWLNAWTAEPARRPRPPYVLVVGVAALAGRFHLNRVPQFVNGWLPRPPTILPHDLLNG